MGYINNDQGLFAFAGLPDVDIKLPVKLKFHGPDVEPEDEKRLTTYLEKTLNAMCTGKEFTLRQLSDIVGCGEATVSARIRQLRSLGYTIDRRRDSEIRGLFWYRLDPNK